MRRVKIFKKVDIDNTYLQVFDFECYDKEVFGGTERERDRNFRVIERFYFDRFTFNRSSLKNPTPQGMNSCDSKLQLK